MDYKGTLEKAEEFAKKIINLAANEKLTVKELCMAADIAKASSENSIVETGCIEKTDFTSRYISAD